LKQMKSASFAALHVADSHQPRPQFSEPTQRHQLWLDYSKKPLQTKRLKAEAPMIIPVPASQCPVPETNNATSFSGSTNVSGTNSKAID
jgi:hypothetical protein